MIIFRHFKPIFIVRTFPKNRSIGPQAKSSIRGLSSNLPAEKGQQTDLESQKAPRLPDPVPQQYIARIPVEYHGIDGSNFPNEKTEWLPIFRSPYIVHFKAVIKFKVYLTGLTAALLAFRAYNLVICGFGTNVYLATALPSISLVGLIIAGSFARRIVCQIYASEDSQHVRLCRLTFFGKRRDMVLPIDCVVPLTDTNTSNTSLFVKLHTKPPKEIDLSYDHIEFYEETFLIPLVLGGVLDRTRFEKIMGSILMRRVGVK